MRKRMLILGLVTLLVFPIPAFLLLNYFESITLVEFLSLNDIKVIPIGLGLEFGFVYALLAYLIMNAPFFDKVPVRIDKLVQQMNLRWYDGIFLSLCAGIGEELLFRVGVQHYLGWLLTSIVFIAIHGYLNPWNWRFSMYGVILLPFIFLLSIGMYTFGIWFSIAAHFMYDAVLFSIIISKTKMHEG
jgi:hypothetical protein